MSDTRPSVVVTRRLPRSVEQQLMERYDVRLNGNDMPLGAEQMGAVLKSADIVLSTVTDRIRAAELSAPGVRTRLIANFGVGVNHIDLEAARAAGIVVTNTPDVLTDDTADLAIGLMLMVMRRLGEGERHLRSGGWSGWRPTHMLGRTLAGKTLGIVGYGRIGRAVARRASAAFGMTVAWQAPREPRIDDPTTAGPSDARRVDTLDELMAISDVISLHCPATPETRHLMNAERFAQMKSTAYLVNTARGDVVDEWALAAALRERMIAGAGLDVYEHEPSVVAELRDMENVVLLPHLGSATLETRTAMGERALANIDAFVRGDAPPDRVA